MVRILENNLEKHFRRSALLVCVLSLGVSCDVLRDPILCNGFGRQIEATVLFRQSTSKMFIDLKPQECGELSLSSDGQTESNIPDAFSGIEIGVIVRSPEQEVLAKVSLGSDKKVHHLSGLNWKPHWLATPNGLFLIPRESYENWHTKVELIEKSSHLSFPVIK